MAVKFSAAAALGRLCSLVKQWGASSFAAASHNHKAGDITSGTLSASRGGTGQTSLQATRNAMGLGTRGALPIANGGTGSSTAEGARNALGAVDSAGAFLAAHPVGSVVYGADPSSHGGTWEASYPMGRPAAYTRLS